SIRRRRGVLGALAGITALGVLVSVAAAGPMPAVEPAPGAVASGVSLLTVSVEGADGGNIGETSGGAGGRVVAVVAVDGGEAIASAPGHRGEEGLPSEFAGVGTTTTTTTPPDAG